MTSRSQNLISELRRNFNRIATRQEIFNFLELSGIPWSDTWVTKVLQDAGLAYSRGLYNLSSNLEGMMSQPMRPTIESLFITSFDKSQTFGVELEFCSNLTGAEINAGLKTLGLTAPVEGDGSTYSMSGQRVNYSNWNVTYDTSVRGFRHGLEIISPILSGKDGLRELKKVMDYLTGLEKAKKIKVNKTCGTHVHFGKSTWQSYSEFQGYEFFKMYAMNEGLIDLLQPASRRENNGRYCRSCFDAISNSSYSPSGRYYKVNMSHIKTRGTVEVRQHSGTVDFEKIASWIHLMTAMLDRSTKLLSNETKKFQSLNEMMDSLNVANCVKESLRKRFKKLNGFVEQLVVAV